MYGKKLTNEQGIPGKQVDVCINGREWATFPHDIEPIAGLFLALRAAKRYELILVGSSTRNARFVKLVRSISFP